MLVKFKGIELARIDAELAFTGGFSSLAASAFRGRIQLLRAAPQESALLALKSLRMRPHGKGPGEHLIRVAEKLDLLVAFEDSADGRVAVVEAMVEMEIPQKESHL